MDILARLFDFPVDSPEHLRLADAPALGCSLVSVRYYLGRLLGRNLFRETEADVEQRLGDFISSFTSAAGGELVRRSENWDIVISILRYRFEMQTQGASKLKRRNVAAVETFLADPSVTLAELAKKLATTEKQLRRISDLMLARRQAGLRSPG